MKLLDLLKCEIHAVYHATEGLMKLVGDDELGWKPATGKNWMTVGQLLEHLPTACGLCIRGFTTGDWGMPEGKKMEDMKPEEMLLPAEKMPSAKSVAEALKNLETDRCVALEMLDRAGEEELHSKVIAAPWGGPPMTLGQHALHMIGHLANHRSQLFYYLKLMGKDVNTGHLYGM